LIPKLRAEFNEKWSESAYRDFIRRLEVRTGASLGFPLSETPCFFPRALMDALSATGLELANQILGDSEAMAAANAIVPERYRPSASFATTRA
jgi:hypothetical protein